MLEATDTLRRCGLPGAAGYTPATDSASRVAWELRTYQLVLGYSTVPKFLSLYEAGLADKLAADDSGASELATLLYSDCGSLNVVVELWVCTIGLKPGTCICLALHLTWWSSVRASLMWTETPIDAARAGVEGCVTQGHQVA